MLIYRFICPGYNFTLNEPLLIIAVLITIAIIIPAIVILICNIADKIETKRYQKKHQKKKRSKQDVEQHIEWCEQTLKVVYARIDEIKSEGESYPQELDDYMNDARRLENKKRMLGKELEKLEKK